MKKAMITGITGQDGSYLAELLLSKGYCVIGIARRSSVDNTARIKHLLDNTNFAIIEGDLLDPKSVNSWIEDNMPDEFYNLAAQSHVGTSFKQPTLTTQVNYTGVTFLLEAIAKHYPKCRFYQASTSEMFGRNMSLYVNDHIKHYDVTKENPMLSDIYNAPFQSENTPFKPQSPYGVAKLAAHEAVGMYRQLGLHASCGILFNHESERRGEQFVTRKITKWLARFSKWRQEQDHSIMTDNPFTIHGLSYSNSNTVSAFPKLRLGNIYAFRDWGHAEDYVRAMWMMLQQDEPDDYVIATGETHAVEDFLKVSFGAIGIDSFMDDYVIIDPEFYRPAEVHFLRGLPDKAKAKLGWEPQISFNELVERMLQSDVQLAEQNA